MKKMLAVILALALILCLPAAWADAPDDAVELIRGVFEANQLDAIFARHESVSFTFSYPEQPENNGFKWETADSVYHEWGSQDVLYEQDRVYYRMWLDESGSFHTQCGLDFDPASDPFYVFSGDTFEDFFDAGHDHVTDVYTENGLTHVLTQYDETLARQWLGEWNVDEEYTGQAITSETVVDAESLELKQYTVRIERNGVTSVVENICAEYDQPEPVACLNLRAGFERGSENMMTVSYHVDPGTDRELVRTLTVPMNSESGYIAGDVPFVMFNDPGCETLSHWNRMEDVDFYIITNPDEELTERYLELLAAIVWGEESGEDAGDAVLTYRFADAAEAAELLLSNRAYYENLNQNDLNYRMQKTDATLEELEAFASTQTQDFTGAEKIAVNGAMRSILAACAERGYTLPETDGIVFAKTTMAEECGAGAYTHGTQIFLGQAILDYAAQDAQYFKEIVAHELFHCLTRNHPDFRAAMYGILGFTVVDEDYVFPQEIQEKIISNPDVEHHNSFAAFDIGGESKNCVVIFTSKPFEQPGDSFFDEMITGLVPVDELDVMYTSEEAANFWEVFGMNTGYVIDPEETMADNFSYTVVDGPDGMEYASPEIIEDIAAYLKGAA